MGLALALLGPPGGPLRPHPAGAQAEPAPAGSPAAPAPADSAPATTHSLGPGPAPLAPRRLAPPARFSTPFWVMMRTAVVPGWGQLHNGSWTKAIGVAAGEGTLALRIAEDTRELDRLEAEIARARLANDRDAEVDAVEAFNARLDQRTRRSWLLAAAAAYALLDAYVDAHFRGFGAGFEVRPPASEGAGGAGSPEVRLSLEWSF